MTDHWQNYIDGAFGEGGAGTIDVTDPATGAVIATQALASAADVDRAVAAARRLHLSRELTDLRPIERGRRVQAMGHWFLQHAEEIAATLTRDQGKPLWEAHVEIEGTAAYFEYYGNQAAILEGRSIPLGGDYLDWTELEPCGVSAQIVPWNYPLEMAARSLAPALTTGNPCVVKMPELTPLTGSYLARAAEAAGWPADAVNVLCGLGREAGAALAGHRHVDQIVFTGSVPTGIAIATAAARNVVPCVLELGGKSAAIVHADADLDALENDLRWGIFFNAGQVCSAMSRVIVHESRRAELVERAVAIADGLSVGPGIERSAFGANMGALVSDGQRDRVAAIVAAAREAGARVATGGGPMDGAGAFHAPTIVERGQPEYGGNPPLRSIRSGLKRRFRSCPALRQRDHRPPRCNGARLSQPTANDLTRPLVERPSVPVDELQHGRCER